MGTSFPLQHRNEHVLFDALDSLTPERILATVRTAKNLPHHTWMELVPGDNVHNVGTVMMSPLEKYNRLLANQQMDQCLTRTAIRNLMLRLEGQVGDTAMLCAVRLFD